MVIKLISLGIVMCVASLFFLGLGATSDPLFLIISDNPLVVLFRMTATLAALVVAFRSRFTYAFSRKLAAWTGAALTAFGAAGVISRTIAYAFDNYIMPYDYFLIIELGVVFVLAALTYESDQRKFPRKKLMAKAREAAPAKLALHAPSRSKQKSAF
jgi:hypothetical protein